jgi:hypothetical protein
MQTQTPFHQTQRSLTHIIYDSTMEQTILKFWREYQPKLVEELLSKQMLKKTLTQKSNDLYDLQISLQKTEQLHPTLAAMEAWNRLMKLPPDEDEEEEVSMGEMDL